MKAKVFVSGATGFIAQHIVKQLLAKKYIVIGSVRSTAKGEHLKLLFGSNFDYELVPDIAAPGAFHQALEKHPDTQVFIHTASPFHFEVTNMEKELIEPAIFGTRNALQALKEYAPNVNRVVITSSYAAVGDASVEGDSTHTNNEDSWNQITWKEAISNPVAGYRGSKTFAERAAWDFVAKENPSFALSTVNPTYVFGPQAFDSEVKSNLNTSSEIINTLVKAKPDDVLVERSGGFVDVRDVAEAHLVAFEKTEAAGKRLLLNSGRFTTQSILDILNLEFTELRDKIPRGIPYSDNEAIAKLCKIDTSRTTKLIGHDYIGLRDTVVDSVKQILQVE